jgi:hypothetical protein
MHVCMYGLPVCETDDVCIYVRLRIGHTGMWTAHSPEADVCSVFSSQDALICLSERMIYVLMNREDDGYSLSFY